VKIIVGCSLLAALISCGASSPQKKAHGDRSVCEVRPSDCQKRIVPLSAQERDEWAVAQREYADAEKARVVAADKLNKLLTNIGAGKHMPENVRFMDMQFGSTGMVLGGTCMGKVEITPDGYMLYTPANDIRECFLDD
jgi:hypothetical protein